MKKVISIALLLLLSLLMTYSDDAVISVTVTPSAMTWHAWSHNLSTIQIAIDSSSAGDTIFVHNGVYTFSDSHAASIIDKENLTITGESRTGVILINNHSGANIYSGIVIENSKNIIVEGFTVRDMISGISSENSSNISFTDVNVSHSINTSILLHRNYKSSVVNSFGSYNSQSGIVIQYGESNIIDNVQFSDDIYDVNDSLYFNAGIGVRFSNNTKIINSLFENNSYGIFVDFSNNTLIDNNELYTSRHAGIYKRVSTGTTITDNIAQHNRIGLINYTIATGIPETSGNTFTLNIDCDIATTLDATSCTDLTPPAPITDLSAESGSGPKEIDLTWTAPGDNHNYGMVDSYIVKYSTSEINVGNWDSATTYTPAISVDASAGDAETATVTMPAFGTYWFAVRAVDDDSLDNGVSNSVSALSPDYDLSIINMTCVNARTGHVCNLSTSGLNPNTHYFYDMLNFTAYVLNNGNVDETETTRFGVYDSSWDAYTDREETFDESSTTFIDTTQVDLLDDVEEENPNYKFILEIDDLTEDMDWNYGVSIYPFWSIKQHSWIEWVNVNDYPKPKSIGSENADAIFAVYIFMNNNASESFYDVQVSLIINSTFSINDFQAGAPTQCSDDKKTCTYDINKEKVGIGAGQYLLWYVNGLPIGTYEISVIEGIYPSDQSPILTKIISMS